MSGSHGQATRQPQLPTIQQVLHKHLAMLTVLLGWGPQAWCGFPRGTKWRKVECHRNYSLALWVGGCPGVCITATFFFSLKKQKKQKKNKQLPNPCQQFNQYWTVLFLQVTGVLLIIFSFIICFSLPLLTFPAFFLFCMRTKIHFETTGKAYMYFA